MGVPLETDKYYHIYNHANGRENLFDNEGNYYFFLKQYDKYICPILDTFAYCLMPNHIHFAVKIKPETELKLLEHYKLSKSYGSSEKYISKQFANLFSSYTQAFNKQQNRKGSLFMQNFKRKLIDSDNYFKQLVIYIHLNPVHHGFVKYLKNWKFSSFNSYFSSKETKLKRNEVFNWFDGEENFRKSHKEEFDNNFVNNIEFE